MSDPTTDQYNALVTALTLLASQWQAKGEKLHEYSLHMRELAFGSADVLHAAREVERTGDLYISHAKALFDLAAVD